MDLSPIADAAVTAAAGAVTALVAMLIPRLPLLVTWLRVSIDGTDATLLRHAIANAAQGAAQAIAGGQAVEAAIAGMVEYVMASVPGRVKRLGIPRDRLDAMCAAELARVQEGRG